MNNVLSDDQVTAMRECGKILSAAMKDVTRAVRPGISSFELDQVAEKSIRKAGAEPSFKNYEVASIGYYPASLCVSINSEIVHGIPSEDRILQDGDLVSLDLGARYKGVCSDMAVTLPVGKVSDRARELVKVTKECLDRGIAAVVAGHKIGAIGAEIQKHAESHGFGVVRDLVGHGVGVKPHMDPQIPNYGKKSDGPKIVEKMALAIEPMITLGDYQIKTDPDDWTISTVDGSLAAHFEHTIIVVNGMAEVVT